MKGIDGAIDHGQVAKELRPPDTWRKLHPIVVGGRIDQLTLVIQGSILQQQGIS
jgi:hypothetical protein